MADCGGATYQVRADAFFIRTDDGVWLRNNSGSFSVRGAAAYPLVSALFAELDGSRTVDQVCARLPPAQRAAVIRLVERLDRNGFLRAAGGPAEPAPEWMRELYGDHLAFIENWADHPVSRLQRVGSTPVACLGDGTVLRSLTVALAELGFATVTVLTTDPPEPAGRLAELAAAAAGRDHRFSWTVREHPPGTSLSALADDPAVVGAAAVLIASETGPAELNAAEARARGRGQLVAVVCRAGGLLLATPLLTDQAWCTTCLVDAVVADADGEPTGPVAASLAGFQVAHRLFCRVAGPPVPEDGSVTTVDQRTVTVKAHPPRPHPACQRCAAGFAPPQPPAATAPSNQPTRPDSPSAEDPPSLVALQDAIVTAVSGLTDRGAGPLLSVGESDLPQLPLAASRCVIRAVTSTPGATAADTVQCRAVSAREARNQAVLFAMERSAGDVATLRGLGPCDVGAGWSRAEAHYRALVAAALRELDHPGSDRWSPAERPDSALALFLLRTLAEREHAEPAVSTTALLAGFVGARVADGPAVLGVAVGVTAEHAVNGALLDAVSAVLGRTGDVHTAYLRPPADDWSSALDMIGAAAGGLPGAGDAGRLLPWADGAVHLVALSSPELGR